MFIHSDLLIWRVNQSPLVSALLKHRRPFHDNKVDLPVSPIAEWYRILLE